MGFSGFDYTHPIETFNEHVALRSCRNHPSITQQTLVKSIQDNLSNNILKNGQESGQENIQQSIQKNIQDNAPYLPRCFNLANDLLALSKLQTLSITQPI